jgi:hypothetical protein
MTLTTPTLIIRIFEPLTVVLLIRVTLLGLLGLFLMLRRAERRVVLLMLRRAERRGCRRRRSVGFSTLDPHTRIHAPD